MKTTRTIDFRMFHKKVGILFFLVILGGASSFAQRSRPQMNRAAAPERQSQVREPIHQQAPAINRFPSQPHNTVNSGVTPDRSHARINDNNFNRPANGFNRPANNNRLPDNVNNNRPGNFSDNRNYTRPGNEFNNRPGNGFNNGYRGGYNGNNNYRRPVYSPANPSWRYAYIPRRNSVFHTLPSSYVSINFGGFGYRYYDGVFYRPYNNIFRVIAPPIGIFINTLPFGYSRVYVNNYPYYYYDGAYYDYRDDRYTVVSPPVGAIVESIPDGYQTVTIDGETYYVVDGAQYKPVTKENGEIWYQVIKAN